MPKRLDLLGMKFGRLTVLEKAPTRIYGKTMWRCRCDCGTKGVYVGTRLTRGTTTSCGCKWKEYVKDISNQRFGRLVTLDTYEKGSDGKIYWDCVCDCGRRVKIAGAQLRSGGSKSCGCAGKEAIAKFNRETKRTHGGSKTRLYGVWLNMIERCEREQSDSFQNYGGRGIKVCPEWHDFATFRDWAVLAGYDENAPRGECTIDRIDVNGNYCPENCRWANVKTQSNNRRNNRMIEHNGEVKTLSEWVDIYGTSYKLVLDRLGLGWDFERALTAPKRGCCQ